MFQRPQQPLHHSQKHMQHTLHMQQRILTGLKKYKAITKLAQQKSYNEANTMNIVQDICHDVLGYQKYRETMLEHTISGKRCDMAIMLKERVKILVEVKAIHKKLNQDEYIHQALQYGICEGIHCVILTNARMWHMFWLSYDKNGNAKYHTLFHLDILGPSSPAAKHFQNISREHIEQFIQHHLTITKSSSPSKPSDIPWGHIIKVTFWMIIVFVCFYYWKYLLALLFLIALGKSKR